MGKEKEQDAPRKLLTEQENTVDVKPARKESKATVETELRPGTDNEVKRPKKKDGQKAKQPQERKPREPQMRW